MTNASELLLRQPELESGIAAESETPPVRRLNHLRALEAESIYILREAAAEFARPVMLYSIGDGLGQWDAKNQGPELWNIFNSRLDKGESIRVFPLSNWTELDVWLYIHVEKIPIVPLYFAKERDVVLRNGSIVVIDHPAQL